MARWYRCYRNKRCPPLPGKVVRKRHRTIVINQDTVQGCSCWFLEVLRCRGKKWKKKKKVNKEGKNRGYKERACILHFWQLFCHSLLGAPLKWTEVEIVRENFPESWIRFGTWRDRIWKNKWSSRQHKPKYGDENTFSFEEEQLTLLALEVIGKRTGRARWKKREEFETWRT